MNIYDQFSSNYLKAADLQGRRIRVKVERLGQETVGQEGKWVMYFERAKKPLILNRTNAMTIAEVWGPETDNWVGGELELFSMKVPFQGKLTDALRVNPLPSRQASTPPRQNNGGFMPNARQSAPPSAPPPDAREESLMADAGGPFDDDVPF